MQSEGRRSVHVGIVASNNVGPIYLAIIGEHCVEDVVTRHPPGNSR